MAQTGLSANQMAGRILNREDNIYKKEIIYDVLKMYMDECRKALLDGERVVLTKLGTITPKLGTHIGSYNLSTCDKYEDNPPPYVKVKLSLSTEFRKQLNEKLRNNIENGEIGLGNLSFDARQMTILKNSGFIPEETEEDYEED